MRDQLDPNPRLCALRRRSGSRVDVVEGYRQRLRLGFEVDADVVAQVRGAERNLVVTEVGRLAAERPEQLFPVRLASQPGLQRLDLGFFGHDGFLADTFLVLARARRKRALVNGWVRETPYIADRRCEVAGWTRALAIIPPARGTRGGASIQEHPNLRTRRNAGI